ncbi:MAG TPA: peptidase T [Gaiellaceae bacterium]|nr:peptidase T [Gaiellaceae bacterium]
MELAAQLADDAAERLVRYAEIDTQSDEDSETYPSTAKQLDLLNLLLDELREIGLDAQIDEHGYVTATIAATVDDEVATIAFFAHVDTAREVTGTNVRPRRIRYEGGEIPLGNSGSVIRPEESPQLPRHEGHELIVTDGTTLLGADDKAGIAEIMAATAYLVAHPEVPHGTIKVAFNPDEEIGRGVIHFPVETFGARAAYTLDGSTIGEIQEETFSGAQVRMHVKGRSIHPGLAKGELVNAIKLAAEIVGRLPKGRLSPETTGDREGYVHPTLVGGDSSEVELRFIVRDFDDDMLDKNVEYLRGIAEEVAASEPRATIEVESRIQYRNMRHTLEQHPEIVENLEAAVRRIGFEPKRTAIRGGTDGSALTEMGLPTPNIYTGGQDAHSEREWICVEDMGLAAATIIELAKVWANR